MELLDQSLLYRICISSNSYALWIIHKSY